MSRRSRRRGLAAEKTRVANNGMSQTNMPHQGKKSGKTHKEEVERLMRKYNSTK